MSYSLSQDLLARSRLQILGDQRRRAANNCFYIRELSPQVGTHSLSFVCLERHHAYSDRKHVYIWFHVTRFGTSV